MKTLTADSKTMSKLSTEAQSKINEARSTAMRDIKRAQANDLPKDEKDEKTPEKSEKTPKTTKKQVVIEMISKEGGSLITDIAQEICDRGLDPDLDKNKRVTRLWLSKLGMPVRRLENGNYIKG